MIEVREFGYYMGYRCDLITLDNGVLKAELTNFGAAVRSLWVPDRNGVCEDVVLGYDTLEEYVKGGSCHGASVGRFANRIGGARFELNGVKYALEVNDGANTLHSGSFGFNKRVWSVEAVEDGEAPSVTFSLLSPDGDSHFPGSVKFTARYVLNGNGLEIEYSGTPDADTPINLTNHSYFNLRGEGSGDVKDHIVRINAKTYTPVDAGLIPTGGIAYVAGTPYDFLEPKRVGDEIESGKLPGGYDNNFVLRQTREMRTAATVEEHTSGRVMTVETDKPGIQFYTAGGLNGERGKNGHTYERFGGLCLESQFFPDSPNKADFPSCIVKAGQEYLCRTVYRFGTK